MHNIFKFNLLVIIIESLVFGAYCNVQTKFNLPERLNVEVVYEILDRYFGQYEKINLARGMPEVFPPSFLIDALTNVTLRNDLTIHEYMPSEGYAELQKEIALFYSALINRPLNMSENVVITVGATHAIYLCISTFTEPGDEWILLEPAFEDYMDNVKIARGTVVPVQLHLIKNSTADKSTSRDFVFNKEELTNAFNSKTKGIILNNPHNPTGKSFTKEELLFIGELAVKWNTLIIADEVYEWTNYDSSDHIRIASLGDDIFNQTITLSSLSKTFYASGFRVGWAYGPEYLISDLKTQIPFQIYAGTSYVQVAAVEGIKKIREELGSSNSYLENHQKELKQKRDFAVNMLDEIGMDTIVPEAGFFIYMNWTSFKTRTSDLSKEIGNTIDYQFLSWLIKKTGVLLYPGTGLYLNDNPIGEDFIRLSFAKGTDVLEKAASALQILKE